jgi:CheY-like chemotaxis protein
VFDSPTARKILVVSGNPDVREGWAHYFEARGLDVVRCAGPEATHCALERGAHCPLLDEADAAYYDNTCVTEDLAADLIKRPRLLPIFIANDKPTPEGDHVPEVSRAI